MLQRLAQTIMMHDMTIRIAILIFLASFAAITSWLVMRQPADSSIAQSSPVPNTNKEDRENKEKNVSLVEVVAISDAERYVRDKLNRIIIPLVDFKNTSVEEAMDYVRLRARELDPEEDNSRKGVSFFIRKPVIRGDLTDGLGEELDAPAGEPTRTITGRLKNKPLPEVLDFICEQGGLRWQITDHGIELTPLR